MWREGDNPSVCELGDVTVSSVPGFLVGDGKPDVVHPSAIGLGSCTEPIE
jgi:hypothetical protein